MNDHRLPPDELASAFLDDELTAAEAEAVRQDPDLAARVDALRQATEPVGEAVSPPPGAADAAVEAALADFDARRPAPVDLPRRRPREFAVITGVAAAVAVGFIVAAAVGLFAGYGDDEDTAPVAAPPPEAAPALDEQPAAAPEPPPPPSEPAPAPADDAFAAPDAETEAMEANQAAEATAQEALDVAEAAHAAAALAQATAEGNQEAVAAAEAAPAEAQAAAETDRAEASAAQGAAAGAQAEADRARDATVEAAPAAAPAPEPSADMAADSLLDACSAVIGDGTVELRITVGDTPLLVVRSAQEQPAVLVAATCDEVPADEPAAPTPDACATVIGDGTVELRITVGDTPLLVVRSAQEQPAVLVAATCDEVPPG